MINGSKTPPKFRKEEFFTGCTFLYAVAFLFAIEWVVACKMRLYRWPYGKRFSFVIRDDDINYFTDPFIINEIYKEAYRKNFVISLACIPMVKNTHEPLIPQHQKMKIGIYPIFLNEELVKNIRSLINNGKVEVLQHGAFHTEEDTHYNFFKAILEGKKILENHFVTNVDVYVPPWERVNKQLYIYLKRYFKGICFAPYLFYAINLNFLKFIKSLMDKMQIYPLCVPLADDNVFIIPSLLKIHKSIIDRLGYSRMLYKYKNLIRTYYNLGGYLCVMTHHWELKNLSLLQIFDEIIDYVSSLENVWKTGVSSLVNWLIKLRKLNFSMHKDSVKLFSLLPIKGLTLKLDPYEEIDFIKNARIQKRVYDTKGSVTVELDIADNGEIIFLRRKSHRASGAS